MPKWSDFGNVWTTLRELDANAIRNEAEHPLAIACVGHNSTIDQIDQLMQSGAERYGPAGSNPIELVPLDQTNARAGSLASVDMLIIGVDTRVAITQAEADAFSRLEHLAIPFLVVLLYGERPASGAVTLPRSIMAHTVVILDPDALQASDQLATAVWERLPSELHLAAARRLPGLRATFARELVRSTAFTNATYALASGLPEQIPIINVPFAAADIIVLTKNQALMVYRLALAYGAPPEFQDRIREVLPVVGGAFLWRQAARSLVGLIPIWGLVPKVAIAYAGTYTVGVAAWRWYANGELVSADQLKRISQEAIALGQSRAAEIISRARNLRSSKSSPTPANDQVGLLDRLKRRLPRRNKPSETTTSTE